MVTELSEEVRHQVDPALRIWIETKTEVLVYTSVYEHHMRLTWRVYDFHH